MRAGTVGPILAVPFAMVVNMIREAMRHTRRWCIIGSVFASILFLLGLAWADKVSDFKTAASKSGCEAIPYDAERQTCKTKQEQKNAACTKIGCDLAGTERLLKELEQKRRNLKEAKERNNQSAIPALEKRITEVEGELKDRKTKAVKQMEQCDACVKAREEVQGVFSDARKKVQAEKDPALKTYIDRLVAHYDAGAKDHVRPIEQVKAARNNCKKVSEIRY